MPERKRLFTASPVAPQSRDVLNAIYEHREKLSSQIAGGSRWVPPEQWHLTWLFLGDIGANQIPDFQDRLSSCLQNLPVVTARLQDLVLWPNEKRPNVLVCRIAPSPALSHVCEVIHQAWPEVRDDKQFRPHVTLARIKTERASRKVHTPFQPDPLPESEWTIDNVVLYQSILSPQGAVYQPLHTVILNAHLNV